MKQQSLLCVIDCCDGQTKEAANLCHTMAVIPPVEKVYGLFRVGLVA